MTHNEGNLPGMDKSGSAQPQKRTPVFNLPSALVVMLAFLILVHAVSAYALSGDAYEWFLFTFGFIPARYAYPLAEQGLEWLWTPVTYSFLHGGLEHIIFNGLWLMAFGAPVMRRIGTARFALFWAISAAISAFGHSFLNWASITVLIGASGVVSALMGAACRFAFPLHGRRYDPAYGHLLPRQGIFEALTNRTVLFFTLMWLVGNLLIAFGVPLVGAMAGEIAWDAHVFGFLFGFLFFSLFDRRISPVAGTASID